MNSNNKITTDKQNQSNGYIYNINFDDKTATCTIHSFTTPEERIFLETKAQEQLITT